MTYGLWLFYLVSGLLWRREFGRCVVLGKTALKIVAVPFFIPILFLFPLHQWYCGATTATLSYLVVIVFFTMSFYPGGKYVDDKDVLLKYGPFGLGYVLAHRWWNDKWNTEFINGADPVGECFLGASVFACLGLVWFWIL